MHHTIHDCVHATARVPRRAGKLARLVVSAWVSGRQLVEHQEWVGLALLERATNGAPDDEARALALRARAQVRGVTIFVTERRGDASLTLYKYGTLFYFPLRQLRRSLSPVQLTLEYIPPRSSSRWRDPAAATGVTPLTTARRLSSQFWLFSRDHRRGCVLPAPGNPANIVVPAEVDL